MAITPRVTCTKLRQIKPRLADCLPQAPLHKLANDFGVVLQFRRLQVGFCEVETRDTLVKYRHNQLFNVSIMRV